MRPLTLCRASPSPTAGNDAARAGTTAARASVLANLDSTPPVVVHQAESAGLRFPYEVLFRSAYKLLMDTATSEYLFCHEFWAGDSRMFNDIFAASFAAVDENLNNYLAGCQDVLALILMARAQPPLHVLLALRRAECAPPTTSARRSASRTSTRSSWRAAAYPAWTATWTRRARMVHPARGCRAAPARSQPQPRRPPVRARSLR